MKIHRLIMLIALIAGLPAAPLIAAEHSNELWHETRITDTTSGKFNYCAVESGFDNGLYLAFARNRDFNTNIVISFPDKRLQDHTKYRMMVGIDANPIRDLMGFAADPSILVIPLQHDRKILEWLRTGKLLDVKGPQDAVKFSLDGAAEAFKKLQQCVEQSLKDETQGVKPQAAPVPGDVARPVSEMVMPLPLPASKAVGSPSVDATVAKAIAEPVTEASAPPSPAPLVQPAPVLPPPAAPAKPVVVIADAAPQTAAAVPQVAVPVPPAPKFVPAPAATVSAAPAPAAPVISAPAAMPSAPVAPPVPASSAGMIALPAAETGTAHLSVPALLGKTGLTISGKCTDKSQDCKWSGGTLPGSVVPEEAGQRLPRRDDGRCRPAREGLPRTVHLGYRRAGGQPRRHDGRGDPDMPRGYCRRVGCHAVRGRRQYAGRGAAKRAGGQAGRRRRHALETGVAPARGYELSINSR